MVPRPRGLRLGRAKKLRDLGRHWAGAGSGGKNELASDAEILGVSLPDSYFEPETCDCWPEHWDALQVFLSCGSQWRTIAGAKAIIYQGLDYGAIETVIRLRGIAEPWQVFEQVGQIERGALEVINGAQVTK